MLEHLFKLSEHHTNIRTEITAGITTFLTMAYIVIVNPLVLSSAGMDHGSVLVATCLASVAGCFIMGCVANYPITQAPGMGLNAFFTYTVVLEMGYSWQAGLAAVFVSGALFIILSIFQIREWLINSIPISLRVGISAGIGLFLALIALSNAKIIVASPATLVSLGDLSSHIPILASIGFFLTVTLVHKKIKGAVVIGILAVTGLSLIFADISWDGSIISAPPSIKPTFMQFDFSAIFDLGMVAVIFAFLFVDLFDTAGTLVGVASKANLLDKDGKLPRLSRALLADSSATVIGSILGTSNTTSYVESVSGVAEGGKTGLTAVIVGILFLLAIFFSPLIAIIPIYATSGALFYVAILMLSGLLKVNWDDLTDSAPVVVACLTMPLSFSISDGISLGFISYTAIKLLTGKRSEISLSVWIMTIIFLLKYIFG